MKITFILPNVRISGGVKAALEIANGLNAKGHEVMIVYPLIPRGGGTHWYDMRKKAAQLFWTSKNVLKGPNIKWFDVKAKIVRLPFMYENWLPKSDIFIVTWWQDALFISQCSKLKGAKMYFIQSYEAWGGPPERVDSTYRLPLIRFTPSSYLKEFIENRFEVPVLGPFLHGIDLRTYYFDKRKANSQGRRRVGLLYRRNEGKGMSDGLMALHQINKEISDITLVLFGERPTRDDMKIIRCFKNMEFYHLPYKDQLREIYNSLDVFLFPSRFEGFGLPPMEAMACGVAVVSTNVGAVTEYSLPGQSALIVNPGDRAEMAQCVLELLRDDLKRIAIAKCGHDYILQFKWDKTVDKLEKCLNGLLEETYDIRQY